MKKNRTPKYVLSSAALMAFIVAGCANTEKLHPLQKRCLQVKFQKPSRHLIKPVTLCF